jgi:hypothetical protein
LNFELENIIRTMKMEIKDRIQEIGFRRQEVSDASTSSASGMWAVVVAAAVGSGSGSGSRQWQ